MELISIIIPCRNEEKYIDACLSSVAAFELPDNVDFEALIIDGMSEDQTVRLIEAFSKKDSRFQLLENPQKIQSAALNLGLRKSIGRYIMRLDAHTHYPANYLLLCHATALRTGAANVGGICITHAGGETYQASLVQALTTHKFGVGNSGFRVGANEGPADTVPFGFFRRELFDKIGGFDERLVRAQDYEFNRRIKASGQIVWLNPGIQSSYFNQPTLRAFFDKQFLREAPYNAYMWYLAPYSFAVRHAITGAFAVGIISGLALAPITPWIAWPFLATVTLYAALATGAAIQQAIRYRQLGHLLALPPCFFAYHFLHGIGLLVGIIRLACGTAPVQKFKEPWPNAGFMRFSFPPSRQHHRFKFDS